MKVFNTVHRSTKSRHSSSSDGGGQNWTRMKKIFLYALLLVAPTFSKAAVDYNGNPLNRFGRITITPQTSSTVLASYTQVINTAGLLDNTFGSLGIATKNISGTGDRGYGMALQSDGKIIIVGETNANATENGGVGPQTGVFTTMRYNTNGSLDTSFGPNKNGIVQTSFSGAGFIDGATGVAIQADGKIIVVGQTNIYGNGGGVGYFGIIRYNPDGSPDTTFGTNGNGTVTKNFSGFIDGANGVLIQPDGKILVAGGTNFGAAGGGSGNIVVLRYNSNGSLDDTFNGSGFTTLLHLSAIGDVDLAYAFALQADGKIVVVGATNILNVAPGVGNIFILRYTANGILDNSFGAGKNGIVQTNISGLLDQGYGIVLQPNGSIVVVGAINLVAEASGGAGSGSSVLLRYTSNGILDATFGSSGPGYSILHLSATGQIDIGAAVALQPDGRIIIVGSTNYVNGGVDPAPLVGNIFIARYATNGTLDTTFGPSSTGSVQLNISGWADGAYATALQPDGKIVVAGLTNYAAGLGGGQPAQGKFFLIRYVNPFTLATFTASYGNVGLL